MTVEQLIANLIVRMAEIDSRITTDGYDTPVCPTGDDYNLLWDALIDEIRAAAPALNVGEALQVAAKRLS